jgi:hypothetical protein
MSKELLEAVTPIIRESFKPDTSGVPVEIRKFREIYRLATTRITGMSADEKFDAIAKIAKPFAGRARSNRETKMATLCLLSEVKRLTCPTMIRTQATPVEGTFRGKLWQTVDLLGRLCCLDQIKTGPFPR